MKYRYRHHKAASKAVQLRTARHEVGHMYIAKLVGIDTLRTLVRRDGMGIAYVASSSARPIARIRVAVAGYLSECILEGRHASAREMSTKGQYGMDMLQLDRALEDGRVRPNTALPREMSWVHKELSKPEVKARLERLAQRLVRTRVMYGREI